MLCFVDCRSCLVVCRHQYLMKNHRVSDINVSIHMCLWGRYFTFSGPLQVYESLCFFALYSGKLLILKLFYWQNTSHQRVPDTSCFWNVILISSKYTATAHVILSRFTGGPWLWSSWQKKQKTRCMFKAQTLLPRPNLPRSTEAVYV